MKSIYLHLILLGTTIQSKQCPSKEDNEGTISLDSCLNKLDQNIIIKPSNKNFKNSIFEWNSRIPEVKPLMVIQPNNSDDISKAIKCLNQFNKTIAIRSGGHSYEGYSLGGKNDSIVIDLKNMNQVNVNPNDKTAWIESGALLGKIYWETWNQANLALPAGTCPTVGIGGHATGGGFGRYSRTYGMVVDNILEIEVIDYQGRILKANKQQNSDLFWALRGSGTGSLGVITKFQFQLFKPPSSIANFNFDFQAKSNEEYALLFQKIQSYCKTLPLKIGATLGLYPRSIGFSGVILADNDVERQNLMNDMKNNLPKSNWDSLSPMNFMDTVLAYSGLPQGSTINDLGKVQRWDFKKFFKAKGGFISQSLDQEFLVKLADKMSKAPGGTFILLDVQGGKVNSISEGDTAVAHRRGLLFDVQMIADAKTNEEGNKLLPWLNETYDLLKSKINGGYINYIDEDVKDWGQFYYGNHFDKLKDIKKKYDPKNLFNNPRSIPL